MDVQLLRNDMKKKVNEGIHYRKIRKLAQQHNHRHFDHKNLNFSEDQRWKGEDQRWKGGLIGNNNLIEVSRINSYKNR